LSVQNNLQNYSLCYTELNES